MEETSTSEDFREDLTRSRFLATCHPFMKHFKTLSNTGGGWSRYSAITSLLRKGETMQTALQSIEDVKQRCCERSYIHKKEYIINLSFFSAFWSERWLCRSLLTSLRQHWSSTARSVGLSFKRIRGPRSARACTGQGVTLAPPRWSGLRRTDVNEEGWARLCSSKWGSARSLRGTETGTELATELLQCYWELKDAFLFWYLHFKSLQLQWASQPAWLLFIFFL